MFPLSSFSREPLQPVPSLWRMIEEQLAPSERLEVKAVLGDDLVEHSLELHTEVETLLEFYQELQLDHFGQAADNCVLLTAPPHLKELVREEIRLLLIGLQQRALQEGRDHGYAIAKYNPRVVNFALKTNAGNSRPSSGCNTLIRSLSSRGTNDLEPYSNKLNIARIGEISSRLKRFIARLGNIFSAKAKALKMLPSRAMKRLQENYKAQRAPRMPQLQLAVVYFLLHSVNLIGVSFLPRTLLEDECHALEKYITHLQNQLEEVHKHATELQETTHEPTMAELQEEKRAMEQDLQLSQPKSCPRPSSLMSNQFGNSTHLPQLSHSRSLVKGPSFGQINPASNGTPSPDPRDQTSLFCYQPSSWRSHSTNPPLGWIHQNSEECNQAKDSDTKPPRTLGPPTASVYRAAAPLLEPAFLPMPPTEPCPLTRFCPRARLLQCKGPS